jgi:hypothetical protein
MYHSTKHLAHVLDVTPSLAALGYVHVVRWLLVKCAVSQQQSTYRVTQKLQKATAHSNNKHTPREKHVR